LTKQLQCELFAKSHLVINRNLEDWEANGRRVLVQGPIRLFCYLWNRNACKPSTTTTFKVITVPRLSAWWILPYSVRGCIGGTRSRNPPNLSAPPRSSAPAGNRWNCQLPSLLPRQQCASRQLNAILPIYSLSPITFDSPSLLTGLQRHQQSPRLPLSETMHTCQQEL
jgi:hypothetical protein